MSAALVESAPEASRYSMYVPEPPLGASSDEWRRVWQPLQPMNGVDLRGRAPPLDGRPRPLVVLVDTEATGLKSEDHVIQVAAKVLCDGSNEWFLADPPLDDVDASAEGAAAAAGAEGFGGTLFSRYCMPPEGASVPEAVARLTGISDAVLQRSGAVPFAEAWGAFGSWLQSMRRRSGLASALLGPRPPAFPVDWSQIPLPPVVLVAHNAAFDQRMLSAACSRAAIGPMPFGQLGAVSFLCTLRLFRARALWDALGEPPPPRLAQGALHAHFLGRELGGAHNAAADVAGLEAILTSAPVADHWRDHAQRCQALCQLPPRVAEQLGPVPGISFVPPAGTVAAPGPGRRSYDGLVVHHALPGPRPGLEPDRGEDEGRRGGRRWTADHDLWLWRNRERDVEVLAQALGRTPGGVERRLSDLGRREHAAAVRLEETRAALERTGEQIVEQVRKQESTPF